MRSKQMRVYQVCDIGLFKVNGKQNTLFFIHASTPKLRHPTHHPTVKVPLLLKMSEALVLSTSRVNNAIRRRLDTLSLRPQLSSTGKNGLVEELDELGLLRRVGEGHTLGEEDRAKARHCRLLGVKVGLEVIFDGVHGVDD